MSEHLETLVSFFKVLADENRLKIVGLLAQEPGSVEQLAAALGLSSPTVSHHLKRLADAGLVEAKAEGYYSVYSLRLDELQTKAKAIFGGGGLADLGALADTADRSAYDRKVLATFTDETGAITAFPAQQKKYLVLLGHALSAFEPGVRYPEREVNERLVRFNADTARLRRSLVEHGLMAREGGGGDYWRLA